ncbi:hypothetical protein BGZ49_001826 [Haplosporangium sp. Z 27]|nr:hypothetical protein BGZ49_001826 [Haplosporangium sp. Z 27]
MVRLCKVPKGMRQNNTSSRNHLSTVRNHADASSTTAVSGTRSENKAIGDINDDIEDEDEEHPLDLQYSDYYTQLLNRALDEMWLHYNFDSITSFHFNMTSAQKYLSLSTKMANLKVLYLSRPDTILDSHIENTILFIRRNQTAFPKKCSLDVRFAGNWHVHEDFIIGSVDYSTARLNIYKTMCRERSQIISKHMKPAIPILEAVQTPSILNANGFPGFYENVKNIELGRLVKFSDMDKERTEHDEGPGRKDFLRRCDNLRKLRLEVDRHDILTWIADEIRSSESSSTRRPLRNLESLRLTTYHSYNSAIQAFNDGMFAFSTSLRSIRLVVYEDDIEEREPFELRNIRTLKALQLHRLASATSIGDWPCLLPQLDSIKIYLDNVVNINVGSFKQCPNLRSLELHFGYSDVIVSQPKGRPPSILPEHGVLLDPEWTQARADYTLFPVWNLPKLRRLDLYGAASLRFDLRSLKSMQSLETLILGDGFSTISHGISPKLTVDEHLVYRYNDDPFSDLSTPSDFEIVQVYEGSDSPLNSPTSTSFYLNFLHVWTLPNLTTLDLQGTMALVFEFRFLKAMPCLETLKLDTNWEKSVENRLDEYIARQYRIPSLELHDCNLEEVIHKIFGCETKVSVLPKLRTLSLEGLPSVMFYLDLLGSFPKLESISLSSHKPRDIHRYSPFGPNCLDIWSNRKGDDMYQKSKYRDDTLYFKSRLKEFKICGKLALSQLDTISLLTVYAPFLQVLEIEGNTSLNGYWLLQAVREADIINKTYSKLEDDDDHSNYDQRYLKRSRPGQNLMTVSGSCKLEDEHRKDLGLGEITSYDKDVLKRNGLRSYKLNNKYFARQSYVDLLRDRLII